jgi:protein involved in polysaccharide export with SLBB domain
LLALLCTAFGAGAFADIIIVPGDVVAMTCAEDNALNGSYTITDSGQILLKYIGAVEIGGLSEKAAAD